MVLREVEVRLACGHTERRWYLVSAGHVIAHVPDKDAFANHWLHGDTNTLVIAHL